MLILALDSTTDLCSVALLRDGDLLERAVDAGQSHSRRLLPMIDALLAEAGVGLSAIDAIAFGAGPGSFTGLRIACGVAQGLGFAVDRPLLPVGSLEAMALASGAPRTIACLDARMGEVYVGAFERSAGPGLPGLRALTVPQVAAPAAFPLPAGAGWVGCGNGFSVHAQTIDTCIELLCRNDPSRAPLAAVLPQIAPHAREVAQLGARAFAAGEAIAADLAMPRYVRNKVALDSAEQAALRGAPAPALAGVR